MANWRQNPVVAIVAGAVLVLAIVLTVIALQGPKLAYSLKCESCNTEFQAKLSKSTIFPVTCPSCGKKTAYQLIKLRCKACGKSFTLLNKSVTETPAGVNLAERAADRPQSGSDPRGGCPHCGAQGQLEEVK